MNCVPDIRQTLLLEQFYSTINKKWMWEYNYRAANGELLATGCAVTPEIARQRTEKAIGHPLTDSQIKDITDEGRE